MLEYEMPSGVPTGSTYGVVLSEAYEQRVAPIAHLYQHQFTAMNYEHPRATCPDCQRLGELKPRPDETVLCALCRCCSLMAEEDADGADFCSGGCEPPATLHAEVTDGEAHDQGAEQDQDVQLRVVRPTLPDS